MGYRKTTALKKIRALKKRIKIIQGGTSSSKTISILIILIDRCCQYNNLEVSVVSESVPHLKKGALKDFLKIMKATGRFIKDNYNISDRKYTFTNGSYIEFFSPESVLGARRDILYVNECNHITFADYHQLSIRTNREIFLDYNPAAEFWVQTEVEKDEEDAEKIVLTYMDNEALDTRIVKEIEKARDRAGESEYWANWWKVYGLGLQGTIEGIIFGKFKQVKTFPEDCKWVIYGMDFGFTNDPTTLIKVGMKEGELYFQQLIWETGLISTDIHYKLAGLNIGEGEIIADSASPTMIEELRRRGWNIKGCVKGKDSVKDGINQMKKFRHNIVEDSTDLIKEWRGYTYKFDKDKNKFTEEPVDALNHGVDASRYAVTYKSSAAAGVLDISF